MTEYGHREATQTTPFDPSEQRRRELLHEALDAIFVRLVLLLLLVSMMVGSLGPWGTLGGFLGVSGTSGDGVLALAASMLAALSLLWTAIDSNRRALALCVAAGAIAASIAFINGVYIFREAEPVSIGWGLWLVGFSGTALAAGAANYYDRFEDLHPGWRP